MNLKNCSNPILLGIILCVVGIAASGILAWVSGLTAGAIAEAKDRKLALSLSSVLPGDMNVGRSLTVDGVTFYGAEAADGSQAIAAVGSTQKGYAGKIEGLIGLSPDGRVLTLAGGRAAVIVTQQQETPGLGTNVCNRTHVKTLKTLFGDEPAAEGMPGNAVLDSFAGIAASEAPLSVTKDGGSIEFITGATITSRAVTDLVSNVLTVFERNRDRILEEIFE